MSTEKDTQNIPNQLFCGSCLSTLCQKCADIHMITKGEEHKISNLSEYKANDLTNIIIELKQHSNTYTKNRVYLEEVSDTTASLSICSPELVEKIQEIFKEVKKEQEQMDLVNEKTLKLVNTECDPIPEKFIEMERLNKSFKSFNKYYPMVRVIHKLYKTCSTFDAMRERNVKVSNKIDSLFQDLLRMIAEKKEQLEKIKNRYKRFKKELKVAKKKYKRLFKSLSKKLNKYRNDENSHKEHNVDSLEDINKNVEEVDREEYEDIKDKIELAKAELDYIIMEKLKLRGQIEESEIKLRSLDLDIMEKKIKLEEYEPKVKKLQLIAGKYEGLIDIYKKVERNITKLNDFNGKARSILEDGKNELANLEKQARGKLNKLIPELKKYEELKKDYTQKLNNIKEVYESNLKCKDILNEELHGINNKLERLEQEVKEQEEIKEKNRQKIKNAKAVVKRTRFKAKQAEFNRLEENNIKANSNKYDNKNSNSCDDIQQENKKSEEEFSSCSSYDSEGELVYLNNKEESKYNKSTSKVKRFWIACTQSDKTTKQLNHFQYNLKKTEYKLWIPFIRYMNWTKLTSLKLCDFKEKPTIELWKEVISAIEELKELLVLDLSRNNLTFDSIKELLKVLSNHDLRCLILDDIIMKEEKELKEIIAEHLSKTKLKHFSAKNVPIRGMFTKLWIDKELKKMKLEHLNICCRVDHPGIEKMYEEYFKEILDIYHKTRIDLKLVDKSGEHIIILRGEITHECKHE